MEFIIQRATVTSPSRLYSNYEYDTPFAPRAYEVEEQARQATSPAEAEIRERTDRRQNIEIHTEEK